jgi:hypothetical protein
MTCKLLELFNEHQYIDYITFLEKDIAYTKYTEDMFTSGIRTLPESHVICDGYFQRSGPFIDKRNELLATIRQSHDIFVHKLDDNSEVSPTGTNFKRYMIRNLFEFENYPSIPFEPNDLVISIRLDDFIQMPCP